ADSIKPGVKRSETPGMRRKKYPKLAERPTVDSSPFNVLLIASSVGRFAGSSLIRCFVPRGYAALHPGLYAAGRFAGSNANLIRGSFSLCRVRLHRLKSMPHFFNTRQRRHLDSNTTSAHPVPPKQSPD